MLEAPEAAAVKKPGLYCLLRWRQRKTLLLFRAQRAYKSKFSQRTVAKRLS